MPRELSDEEVFGPQPDRMGKTVTSLFPGATVTSGYRDPVKNRKVGGAPNSYHTRGQAVDFVKPPNTDVRQIRAELEAQGLPVTELLDEGDHIHWAAAGDVMPPAPAPQPVELSDEEVFGAAPRGGSRPQPKSKAPAIDPLFMATGLPAPTKPNKAKDIVQSGQAGLLSGALSAVDMFDPVQRFIDLAPGGPAGKRAMDLMLGPVTARSQFKRQITKRSGVADPDYEPQTTEGKYAKTVGEFAPAAALGPGGVARRTAQVVVPALASETAGQLAERAGAPAMAADAARVAGALIAGGLTGARPIPKGAKAPKAKAPAPTLDQLQTQKRAAYKAVDDAGVVYKPEAVDSLVAGMSDELRAANISPFRHSRAYSYLAELEEMRGRPLNLPQLDALRQSIRRDTAADAAERFFGEKMIRNIDEFIDAAGPQQMSAGNPRAAELIRRARAINTQVKKLEAVEDAVGSAAIRTPATGSGGNIDNATRQKLVPLIDPKSRQRVRNWTPVERKALEKVIKGSPGQNALRQIGKLSPQGNGLMTALNIGGAMANPVFGIPGLVGAVAKVGADRATARNVKALTDTIARGGAKAKAAERQLSSIPDDATFEEAVKMLRSTISTNRLREIQRQRQLTLAGVSGLLATAGTSAEPKREREGR